MEKKKHFKLTMEIRFLDIINIMTALIFFLYYKKRTVTKNMNIFLSE